MIDVLLLAIILVLVFIWIRLKAILTVLRYPPRSSYQNTFKHQSIRPMRPMTTGRGFSIDFGSDDELHRQFAEEVAANSGSYDFGQQQAKAYEASKRMSSDD